VKKIASVTVQYLTDWPRITSELEIGCYGGDVGVWG